MSESVSIGVKGMKCGGCEATITKALESIEGVLHVKASHLDKKVDVEFDSALTDLDTLEDAITDAGFSVD